MKILFLLIVAELGAASASSSWVRPRSGSSSSSSSLLSFSVLLDGGDPCILGELAAHDSGALELVPLKKQERQRGDSGCTVLFGRGVGRWRRRASGVFEATVQLYVYTTADQPDVPSELLIVCRSTKGGELRGCIFAAEGERPLIGTVRAVPLPAHRRHIARSVRTVTPPAHVQLPPLADGFLGALPAADAPLPAADVAQATATAAVAATEEVTTASAASASSVRRSVPDDDGEASQWPPRPPPSLASLERYRVGELDSVYYIPDVLSAAEEAVVELQLRESPEAMWSQMAGRRVQECGSSLAPSGAGLLVESLPPWMRIVCDRLVALGAFPAAMRPNSVALNEYRKHEGIAAHADGPIYAPRVAILSLFSPAVMRFYGRQPELPSLTAWSEETDTPKHTPNGLPVECVLLRPRSLLIFCGQAYREHCHEIAALQDGLETLGSAATGPLVNGELAGGACAGDVVERGERRVSLTIRHALEFLHAAEAYEAT